MNIPVGVLDGDPGLRGGAHIFVASKAHWHVITDTADQFDAYPPTTPDRENLRVPESRPSEQTPSGAMRGSCLCGQVRYEVQGPFKIIHNTLSGGCAKVHEDKN